MLIRSLRRYLFFIPIALAVLAFSTFVWHPGALIVPVEISGFVDNTERILPILMLPFFSLLLPDTFEIELGLVCGVKTAKLTFSKVIPLVLYTLLSAWAFLLLYRYTPYTSTEYRPAIPIWVPENFKWYLALSFAVTILFFAALFLLVRVITRNCYVPVAIGVFLYTLFDTGLCKDIQSGNMDIRWCLIDPFISVYILGDEVPNFCAERYADLSILKNAWTYNRLLFLILALLLFLISYLLLRREKLHKTFGD